MKKDWTLTQELFDELLSWLNPDRERAGEEYEDIRRRLIKIFTCRNCHEPEHLADETINRVANKVKDLKDHFVGRREPYFYAVANKVHLEYLKRKPMPIPPQSNEDADKIESEYACLEECMKLQTPANRKLVLEYYQGEKSVKIGHRRRLAEDYGIGPNALRIRAFRIRSSLQECMEHCIDQTSA